MENELIKCPECGYYYNPKYLDQVAYHMHAGVVIDQTIKGEKVEEPRDSTAPKMGEDYLKFKEWWEGINPEALKPSVVIAHIYKYFKPAWEAKAKASLKDEWEATQFQITHFHVPDNSDAFREWLESKQVPFEKNGHFTSIPITQNIFQLGVEFGLYRDQNGPKKKQRDY